MPSNENDFVIKSKRRKTRRTLSQHKKSKIPELVISPGFITSRYKKILQDEIGKQRNYIIYGEQGTESKDIARFISFQHNIKNKVIEIYPQNYSSEMLDGIIRQTTPTNPFTIFISQFDLFSVEQQLSLLARLRHCSQQKLAGQPLLCQLQLIIATSGLSDQLRRQLLQLGHWQELPLLPLRQRPQDVEELLAYSCHEFRQHPQQRLDPEVYQQLLQYSWPGNVQQLRRSVARLLLLSEQEQIDLPRAMQVLPDIFQSKQPQPQLCQALLDGRLQWLDQFHPSVRKAMGYLSVHFRRDMTLTQLAVNAHCSPSHLSYLLKNNFSISFKQLLNNLRVLYAQQQLRRQPQLRITDLSLDAGFGDLSHFEKMFKRYSGLTPNQFRKQLRPQQSAGGQHENHVC